MVNIDDIAAEIRLLIDNGQIEVGQRLPAERKLCEMLGVSRGYVRKALSRLEICGAIETRPQSGSYVAEHFFESLVRTRMFLEEECIRQACTNRTDADLEDLRIAMVESARNKDVAEHTRKDMDFHYAMARCSHNTVLAALLKTVALEVVTYYHKYNMCVVGDPKVIGEHESIFRAIAASDENEAISAFRTHISDVLNFSKNLK